MLYFAAQFFRKHRAICLYAAAWVLMAGPVVFAIMVIFAHAATPATGWPYLDELVRIQFRIVGSVAYMVAAMCCVLAGFILAMRVCLPAYRRAREKGRKV